MLVLFRFRSGRSQGRSVLGEGRSRSCVLGLADVVGRHVSSSSSVGFPQPPFAVSVQVLELQDAQPLVSGDAHLVSAAGVEGVQRVVNLKNKNKMSF